MLKKSIVHIYQNLSFYYVSVFIWCERIILCNVDRGESPHFYANFEITQKLIVIETRPLPSKLSSISWLFTENFKDLPFLIFEFVYKNYAETQPP